MIDDMIAEVLQDLFHISFEYFEEMYQFDWLNQQIIVETIRKEMNGYLLTYKYNILLDY